MTESRDLVIVGSGPGGYVAAIRAAQLGRKVTLIEREALGGVCLNWGCIPTKALLKSAALFEDIKRSVEFGIEIDGARLDFPRIIDRSRQVAQKLSGGVQYLMQKNCVEVLMGQAVFLGEHALRVASETGDTVYSYADVIIAAGARARELPNVVVDGELLHSYRTILSYRRLPQRILIIGAGAIGVEFAYFFNTLGAQVTLVEMLDQILPFEDSEIAQTLQKILRKRGMTIKTGTAVNGLNTSGRTVTAQLKSSADEEHWSGDCCLIATGVVPNTDSIGLERTGVELAGGYIKVDRSMRTNVPHHFAIGDVVGNPLLAHVASHEGLVAAENAACGAEKQMHYVNVPSCTYCHPQVASVGLTERAAREKGVRYTVGKIPFSAIGKAIATGDPEGFIKMLVDEQTGEIIGVHILHAEATELITTAAILRSHEGIPESVIETIHPHPTLSEALLEAAAFAAGRPINF